MSQYTVERWHDAVFQDIQACCRIMWAEHPYPSKHFSTFEEYFTAILADGTEDLPSIVCRLDGVLVGAMSIDHIGTNSHFPGTGCIVYNTVVASAHPQATRLLYRALIQHIRDGGGQWYHTTRRVSESEFSSKFRRIPNGRSIQEGP